MGKLKEQYQNNFTGIVITLLFHIIVFVFLIINDFRIRKEYEEAEILMEFPPELLEQLKEQMREEETIPEEQVTTSNQRTNEASNRMVESKIEEINQEYQDDIAEAQKLLDAVNKQLKKEIPEIEEIQMPEVVNDDINPDSIQTKFYSGESNIEYFLENRYHIRIPNPLYLAQGGGKIIIEISVDQNGKVVKAIEKGGNYTDSKIKKYALSAALNTRFNKIQGNSDLQIGEIHYTFIAQ